VALGGVSRERRGPGVARWRLQRAYVVIMLNIRYERSNQIWIHSNIGFNINASA
jgi:hypothetical protein